MRTLFLLAFAPALFAQNGAAITGTVFDLEGEPVAQAPMQFVNTVTKAVFRTASSDRGTYTVSGMPAGSYDLSVEAPGFNPFSRKNVTLQAGETLRLDIRLFDYQLNTLGDGREFRIDQTTPHATPSGPAPRTPDGKPDFTGVWYAQRPVDPGQPEPLPWAQKLFEGGWPTIRRMRRARAA